MPRQPIEKSESKIQRLKRLDPEVDRPLFSCGDDDLDEYYAKDSIAGGKELLAVTYAFLNSEETVLAFASLSNDSISREIASGSVYKKLVRQLPGRKRYKTMPAVKIGRLGVGDKYQRQGLGRVVIDFLKVWFTTDNKTGCRFLLVDAYNDNGIISFYEGNDFLFLTGSDKSESTRIMYFDLKRFTD